MSSLQLQTLEDFAIVETFVERRQKQFKFEVENPQWEAFKVFKSQFTSIKILRNFYSYVEN